MCENNFMNDVNFAAFIIGLINLMENEQQSAYNDVHAANDKQAKFLLAELDRRFQEQNAILAEQTELLKNIAIEIHAIYDHILY